ncbi:DUF3050 domain-containing protein [uncultured Dokdonia sp.]|uniref:DUF3050 domain-containing protein n=1 Tax=uncultured Dokdonia sp. TaxID=575653 RepID=UPI0026119DAD|nr:DUF3050 domain-containing protein [uncultured Dokdonia sp.]
MITTVEKEIKSLQEQLLNHPLYKRIHTPEDLVVFMEHHVYAVWDFMSLLKALQRGLTCTTLPWKPVGNPETRYLINEIVLAEETDINAQGKRVSHYEMYLDAMRKAGADTTAITAVVNADYSGERLADITGHLPESVQQFLQFTFEVIMGGNLHEIAAAFTFGREDLIPSMFTAIIGEIETHFPENDLTDFKYYFDRHIELDEDEHGPMALEMVRQLCGDDQTKWQEVITVSKRALEVRLVLWDGILEEIEAPSLVS